MRHRILKLRESLEIMPGLENSDCLDVLGDIQGYFIAQEMAMVRDQVC